MHLHLHVFITVFILLHFCKFNCLLNQDCFKYISRPKFLQSLNRLQVFRYKRNVLWTAMKCNCTCNWRSWKKESLLIVLLAGSSNDKLKTSLCSLIQIRVLNFYQSPLTCDVDVTAVSGNSTNSVMWEEKRYDNPFHNSYQIVTL